jgi:catecholate siderophore receptor
MYQNLYVAAYDATAQEVALDGYRDPTTRENLIISANFVNELELGSATHTILFGVEVVDTDNKNFRYNTYFTNAGALPLANDAAGIYAAGSSQAGNNDRETFSIADMRAGIFNRDEAGAVVTLDFTSSLNNSTTTEFEVTSFFLQDQIDVSDNLKILLGARYDDYEITVVNLKPGFEATVTKGEDLVSPRAGIIFKPQDNISVYASYSNTFAPVAGEQYKAMSNNSTLSAVLDASETENTEIGLKWAISDELFFTAAYFDAERTAMQAVTVGGVAEQQADVNQNVDGIEIELAGRISDQLELTMSYADFEGDTVAQNQEIPDYQFSAFANYQVNDKFGIGFGVTSQGDQQIGTSATPYLPSFTRVDVAAYYQIADDLMLQMNIENLTDETYFPHSHSTHQASVGEEVNANFSIRRTF